MHLVQALLSLSSRVFLELSGFAKVVVSKDNIPYEIEPRSLTHYLPFWGQWADRR